MLTIASHNLHIKTNVAAYILALLMIKTLWAQELMVGEISTSCCIVDQGKS